MKPIYITGFMGAGKTTIGKHLGERLQIQVIDTDQHIEEILGQKISRIFSKHGEAYFRELETNTLKSLPSENIIITTGGGIISKDTNVVWMKEKGTIVYLHAEFLYLMRRLEGDSTRPLLQQKSLDELKKIYDVRLPQYYKADIVIQTCNKSVFEVVDEIVNQIKH